MEYLKIENTTFYIPNLIGWTKDQFINQYSGMVDFDLNDAWELIQFRIKQLEVDRSNEIFLEEKKTKNVRANKKSLQNGRDDENILPDETTIH